MILYYFIKDLVKIIIYVFISHNDHCRIIKYYKIIYNIIK